MTIKLLACIGLTLILAVIRVIRKNIKEYNEDKMLIRYINITILFMLLLFISIFYNIFELVRA